MVNKEKCFFCGSEAEVSFNADKLGRDIICPICGNYFIEGFSSEHFEQLLDRRKNEYQKALLRYYVKKNTIDKKKYEFFEIRYSWIQKILNEKTLPNIIEQTENLILYCGNKFKQGEFFSKTEELLSIVGSESIDALGLVLHSLIEKNLLSIGGIKGISTYILTFDGWVEYEKLKKGQTNSNKAFLAMKFNSEFITDDLISQMKNSLEEIGYQLESLQDRQQVGLIDDHLRQRIKGSKFLIVDLSDANNGAYWEGGYGEGLGKPVIYICDKGQFDNNKSHLDTNHHLTVMYDKNCEDEKNEFHINNFLKKLQDVIKESL